MTRFVLVTSLILATLPVAAAQPVTRPTSRAATTQASEALLNTTALQVIHLKLTQKAWDDMQPTRKGLFSGLFAATKPTAQEQPHESPFGYQYKYVHASVEIGGKTYGDVGLRFKGNSSYLTGRDIKKPFKVDFNRFEEGLTVGGLQAVNLNNNAMDPTLMREALTYEFFRDAGVPASRTASALVYVTVEKLHDRKLAGLYTMVEEVDKVFLKAHFGSAKGLLLKPENCFNLPYLGEDFEKYEKIYRPKSKTRPELSKQVIEFTKLIHQADDAAFAKNIEQYLDVPAFLRFIATNAMLANMDSFLSTGHNFYLYVHPETHKIHFIPWDLNLSFGKFDWVGSTLDQSDLSLIHPAVKPNLLIDRVLSIDRYAKAYRQECARISANVLTLDRMTKQVAELEAVVAQAEKMANVPHRAPPVMKSAETDLRIFLSKRVESVQSQVAQKNEGFSPHWTKGFFGDFGAEKKPATRPATRPAGKKA